MAKKIGFFKTLYFFGFTLFFLIIYFNKVKIKESFNCYLPFKNDIKIERIYELILGNNREGKREFAYYYVVRNFCDCKEDIKSLVKQYNTLSFEGTPNYIRIIKENDYFNSYINYHLSYYDNYDWNYIAKLKIVGFKLLGEDITEERIWFHDAKGILKYTKIKQDNLGYTFYATYSEINRETLQKILNTVESLGYHKKAEKFTYQIQNEDSKQVEVIVNYEEFGKKINLEII